MKDDLKKEKDADFFDAPKSKKVKAEKKTRKPRKTKKAGAIKRGMVSVVIPAELAFAVGQMVAEYAKA